MNSTYELIAYPKGARGSAGTFTGDRADAELFVERAKTHARVRGEFLELERDGKLIATVGAAGPIDDDGYLDAQRGPMRIAVTRDGIEWGLIGREPGGYYEDAAKWLTAGFSIRIHDARDDD